MATNMTAALKIGASMRHTRLVGTGPHNSVVQRRCCATCRTPIYDLKPVKVKKHYRFNCASCRVPVATMLLAPDEWRQVHAVESERHKFSRVPAAILHDHGSDEVEARAARAKTRDPAAQAWFEFAHDDEWVRTDRFPSMHIVCTRFVYQALPPVVVEAAEEVFVRAGIDSAQASQNVAWMVKQALDMLRVNQPELPRIRRKFFAHHFGIDPKSVKSYTRVYQDEFGARQGKRYSPPLAILLDEVDKAVRVLEGRF